MSRVFKFRGWDKIEKRLAILRGVVWDESNNLITIFPESPNINIKNEEVNDCAVRKDIENFELMQFVDLKDKNGKDIFEGDIVKYPEFYNGDYRKKAGVGVIEFIDATFCLVDKNGEYLSELIPDHIYYEVIGNIHENKELLNNE